MTRTFWFALGAASGVYGVVKARRAARSVGPDALAARLAAVRAGAKAFGAEVSQGMAERETELRAKLAEERLLGRSSGLGLLPATAAAVDPPYAATSPTPTPEPAPARATARNTAQEGAAPVGHR